MVRAANGLAEYRFSEDPELTADADGEKLPGDWYLQPARQAPAAPTTEKRRYGGTETRREAEELRRPDPFDSATPASGRRHERRARS